MRQRIAVVDAFTDKAFAGNPAGVCMLEGGVEDVWMQTLAKEMRHSETAFLLPISHPDNQSFASWGIDETLINTLDTSRSFILRWFTPGAEVNICGHATLASAHYLIDGGLIMGSELVSFYTRSGILHVKRDRGQLIMDFPAISVVESPEPAWFAEVLPGVKCKIAGKAGEDDFFVLDSAEAVRSAAPNIEALMTVKTRGMIITAEGDQGYDVVSRFFAPQVGVIEDPVTGSAHCAIGPYWSDQLKKHGVRCYQASERGGELLVGNNVDRVEIIGRAVTILEGKLSSDV